MHSPKWLPLLLLSCSYISLVPASTALCTSPPGCGEKEDSHSEGGLHAGMGITQDKILWKQRDLCTFHGNFFQLTETERKLFVWVCVCPRKLGCGFLWIGDGRRIPMPAMWAEVTSPHTPKQWSALQAPRDCRCRCRHDSGCRSPAAPAGEGSGRGRGGLG